MKFFYCVLLLVGISLAQVATTTYPPIAGGYSIDQNPSGPMYEYALNQVLT
jgi:hypothetical protein